MDLDVNLLVNKYKQKIGELSGDIILLQTHVELLVKENEELRDELQDLKMEPESSIDVLSKS